MNFRSPARPAIALLTMAVILAGVTISSAQDRRPRYTQRHNNDRTWTLPDDTVIPVSMNGSLSSKTSRVGDRFTATITAPVSINGTEVIPAGAIIEGRVTQVTPARRMGKSGAVAIDFDDLIFPSGARVGIVGNLTSDDPETRRTIDDESRVSGERKGRSAVFVGSSGAIGAVLGGVIAGGKGAVLGGVIGAGAGAASILLTKGEEAYVASGTPFGVQLRQPLVIREEFLMDARTVAQSNNDPGANDPAVNQHASRPQPDDPPPATNQPENVRPNQPRDHEPVRDTEPVRDPEPSEPINTTEPATAEPLPLSSPEMIRRAQIALREQGYFEGQADGAMTPRLSNAIKTYQTENKLPETGDLDPQTAKSLGILASATAPARNPNRTVPVSRERSTSPDVVLANIVSASASRTTEGAIQIAIETQASTAGWRWYGDSVVNGDTLEVYARAVRPSGMAAQVLSRGRIDLTVRDGVAYVRRVVIHSSGSDRAIALTTSQSPQSTPNQSTPNRGSSGTASAASIQRQAEDLLAEFQRVSGVRYSGTSVEVDNRSQNREREIELLFAIDNFVNATQLYAKMTNALQDRQSLRSATLSMARQARRTDRTISTSPSPAADKIAARWDAIRQDVLLLMQSYGITTSELDN